MRNVILIGDPLTAAGYRLAGIKAYAPTPEDLAERVLAERGRCDILAMTARVHALLPPEIRRSLQAAASPEVIVVPDINSGEPPGDLPEELIALLSERL